MAKTYGEIISDLEKESNNHLVISMSQKGGASSVRIEIDGTYCTKVGFNSTIFLLEEAAKEVINMKYSGITNLNMNQIDDDDDEPENNDGRDECYWCGTATIVKQGFMSNYNMCPKCHK